MEVNYLEEILVEFWGDFACFAQAAAKVERLTYPFPTPSAAKTVNSCSDSAGHAVAGA